LTISNHGEFSWNPPSSNDLYENIKKEDIEKAIRSGLNLLRDTRILFDTLNTRETFERLLSSARNRPLSDKTPQESNV
jgi:hypothetical protein